MRHVMYEDLDEGIRKLVRDENALVRAAMARHGYGSDVLASDSAEEVRIAVAESGFALDVLAADENWRVRRAAAETIAEHMCFDHALDWEDPGTVEVYLSRFGTSVEAWKELNQSLLATMPENAPTAYEHLAKTILDEAAELSPQQMWEDHRWGVELKGTCYRRSWTPNESEELVGKRAFVEMCCGYSTEDDLNEWVCDIEIIDETDGMLENVETFSAMSTESPVAAVAQALEEAGAAVQALQPAKSPSTMAELNAMSQGIRQQQSSIEIGRDAI